MVCRWEKVDSGSLYSTISQSPLFALFLYDGDIELLEWIEIVLSSSIMWKSSWRITVKSSFINGWCNSPKKPSHPRLCFVKKCLIIYPITLLVISPFRYSISFWVCFNNLSVSELPISFNVTYLVYIKLFLIFPYNPFNLSKTNSIIYSFILDFNKFSLLFSLICLAKVCQFCWFFSKENTFGFVEFLYYFSILCFIYFYSSHYYLFLQFALDLLCSSFFFWFI